MALFLRIHLYRHGDITNFHLYRHGDIPCFRYISPWRYSGVSQSSGMAIITSNYGNWIGTKWSECVALISFTFSKAFGFVCKLINCLLLVVDVISANGFVELIIRLIFLKLLFYFLLVISFLNYIVC